MKIPASAFPKVPYYLGLYPVVDSLEWVRRLLQVGVKTLQLRIKDLPDAEVEPAIIEAIRLGREADARLFINDYWRLAVKHRAYGIHLGQEDLDDTDLLAIHDAGLRLGVSTHDESELARAVSVRPSYIALGHVFPTQTKQMPSSPQGLQELAHHVHQLGGRFPTVAIGGISLDRVQSVMDCGVGSVAVVSAITQASDWQAATRQLLALCPYRDDPHAQ
ncbi:thiamine phosphate synthase [Rouxiella chamberiensis]|uniref:Thiamine-phosphate synthase n=1 Tax=Rouxiella chamberiensis TaxID=1513468 RepID=A0ABY7HLZ4_9GAMM|nr:thiamine phosphate synthase [Rouxiella chamberiensis]WAT00393.1 thiamine phosphate synthase [Rouxiella chamberiensis]